MDDLHEDAHTVVVDELAAKTAGDEEVEINNMSAASSDTQEQDEDSSFLAGDDGESWSDDPVRMYLTQMGEIPLLTRKEEIALAKRIETARAAFRRKLMECDYVARTAFKVPAPASTPESFRLTVPFRSRSPIGWRRIRSWVGCLIIWRRLTR